jgi:RNA polymerase sigma-70 factor (ECF subfamily)
MVGEAILAASVAPETGQAASHSAVARAQPFRGADPSMSSVNKRAEFESLFLPHLDAAFNLARLLTRNAQDAEDVVQEAYLKAWRAYSGFRGGAARPWLLAIVRNHAFTWLRESRPWADRAEFDEQSFAGDHATPEAEAIGSERARAVERCVSQLPLDFREAIILREMEELSYGEIAAITGVPRGTVMSRLSRARARLAECLRHSRGNELSEGRGRA